MPIAKGTNKTDAQRRAENKYFASHFKVVGCKLSIEAAEKFSEKAKANGSNANAVLKELIQNYMENN